MGDDLLQSQASQEVAQSFLQVQFSVALLGRQFIRHAGLGDAVVTVDAGDLLHQVGFADDAGADIQAVIWGRGGYVFALDQSLRIPAMSGCAAISAGDKSIPSQRRTSVGRDVDGGGFGRQGIFVQQALGHGAAGPALHALQAAQHAPWVPSPGERRARSGRRPRRAGFGP